MNRFLPFCAAMAFALTGCQTDAPAPSSSPQSAPSPNSAVTHIQLSDDAVLVNGQTASTLDTADVYTANDIVFYLADQGFLYGEGTQADEHPQSEADAHTVVHITQPGTYSLSGTLSQGQVAVDLGQDAQEDPNAVVTLILDGVDLSCSVAPGVIFYNVYECGNADAQTASANVDTTAAGANVVIADGSTNTINGSYVARIYQPDSVQLNEDGTEVEDAKKLHKYDGAFYSRQSMNITGGQAGTGVLNIHAENEGLGTELHLTINGGTINIVSGNDGINTNEDEVSVTTVNGGSLNITVDGSTGEGDGIDSNGWLVLNGGSVTASACGFSGDAGIDSDMGIHINGGTVAASGNMLDRISDSEQNYAVFTFAQQQEGGCTYALKNEAGDIAAEYTPSNSFTYLIFSAEALPNGTYTLWKDGQQLAGASSGGNPRLEPPEGMTLGQPPQLPGDFARPDDPRPEFPEMPDDQPPKLPEGTRPPTGMGKYPGTQPPESLSTEFVIGQGGSYFSSVSPVE